MEENSNFSQIDVEETEPGRMTVNFYGSQIARPTHSPQSSAALVPSSVTCVVSRHLFRYVLSVKTWLSQCLHVIFVIAC